MSRQNLEKVEIPSIDQVKTELAEIENRRKYIGALRSTIYVLIVVAAVAVLISTLVFPVLQVSGTSMEPTLKDEEIIVLIKTDNYSTGDLVGFYYQNKLLLKRVIATSGDYVDIDLNGAVSVNGKRMDEPYVNELSLGTCDIELPYQVPDGRIFVMGDHRDISIDSRTKAVGCIEKEQIVGIVLFRIWPLNRLSSFD